MYVFNLIQFCKCKLFLSFKGQHDLTRYFQEDFAFISVPLLTTIFYYIHAPMHTQMVMY